MKVNPTLKDHPVSLSSEGGLSMEMEKVLRKMPNGEGMESTKVLELNPTHPDVYKRQALACAGLGNNIRAQNEARAAVEMEPGNYEYQNLLDRLQNPGRTYRTYQQAHTQPGGGNPLIRFCLTLWLAQMFFSLLNCCCCGRGGYYYC